MSFDALQFTNTSYSDGRCGNINPPIITPCDCDIRELLQRSASLAV